MHCVKIMLKVKFLRIDLLTNSRCIFCAKCSAIDHKSLSSFWHLLDVTKVDKLGNPLSRKMCLKFFNGAWVWNIRKRESLHGRLPLTGRAVGWLRDFCWVTIASCVTHILTRIEIIWDEARFSPLCNFTLYVRLH